MLSDDRIAALKWQAERTAEEIINDRESVMRDIEAKGHEFWKNGAAQAWLDEAVPTVRKVVETVNGPLLQYLGAKALHSDIGCVEMLRVGAPLYGRLESCEMCSSRRECFSSRRECFFFMLTWPIGKSSCRAP